MAREDPWESMLGGDGVASAAALGLSDDDDDDEEDGDDDMRANNKRKPSGKGKGRGAAAGTKRSRSSGGGGDGSDKPKKPRKSSFAKHGTGAWSILVTMYQLHGQGKTEMTEAEIVNLARQISNPDVKWDKVAGAYQANKAQDFYTGWSSMKKQLEQKGLAIRRVSRPHTYKLTDEGMSFAKDLERQRRDRERQGHEDLPPIVMTTATAAYTSTHMLPPTYTSTHQLPPSQPSPYTLPAPSALSAHRRQTVSDVTSSLSSAAALDPSSSATSSNDEGSLLAQASRSSRHVLTAALQQKLRRERERDEQRVMLSRMLSTHDTQAASHEHTNTHSHANGYRLIENPLPAVTQTPKSVSGAKGGESSRRSMQDSGFQNGGGNALGVMGDGVDGRSFGDSQTQSPPPQHTQHPYRRHPHDHQQQQQQAVEVIAIDDDDEGDDDANSTDSAATAGDVPCAVYGSGGSTRGGGGRGRCSDGHAAAAPTAATRPEVKVEKGAAVAGSQAQQIHDYRQLQKQRFQTQQQQPHKGDEGGGDTHVHARTLTQAYDGVPPPPSASRHEASDPVIQEQQQQQQQRPQQQQSEKRGHVDDSFEALETKVQMMVDLFGAGRELDCEKYRDVLLEANMDVSVAVDILEERRVAFTEPDASSAARSAPAEKESSVSQKRKKSSSSSGRAGSSGSAEKPKARAMPPLSPPQILSQGPADAPLAHRYWGYTAGANVLPPWLQQVVQDPQLRNRRMNEVFDLLVLVDSREPEQKMASEIINATSNLANNQRTHLPAHAQVLSHRRALPTADYALAFKLKGHAEMGECELMLEWLFERKQVDDLVESIRNPRRYTHTHTHTRTRHTRMYARTDSRTCRYHSQRARMKDTGFENVCWIVEGDVENLDQTRESNIFSHRSNVNKRLQQLVEMGLSEQQAMEALQAERSQMQQRHEQQRQAAAASGSAPVGSKSAELSVRTCMAENLADGCKVFETKEPAQTARHLLRLARLVLMLGDGATTVAEWCNDINVLKLEWNVFNEGLLRLESERRSTVGFIFGSQLMQIKRVSSLVASAIISKYPTLAHLYQSYDTYPPDKRPTKLSNLAISEGSNKLAANKIGPTTSANIHSVFCAGM